MSLRGSLVLLAVFFIAMQVLVLPPDGFVTGDQGSKFLQTRAFATGGPLNPSIEVAAHDIDPDFRRQEPKLKNRRGRLVSEFLWLLPLLGAPFYLAFGMRGLYVVPALSAVVAFLAAAALGRRLGEPHGLWTAWIAIVATPVAVYGLELWEHAPAAACVLVAAALVAPRICGEELPPKGGSHAEKELPPEGGSYGERFKARVTWLPPSGGRSAARRAAAAGAVIAIGVLFREEVVTALPALAIARALSVERDRVNELITSALWMTVGAAVVFLASVPVNMTIYGAPLPMHVTQDAWQVAKSTPYLQVRRDVVVDLLLPASHAILYVTAIVVGLAAALGRRFSRGARDPMIDRALLAAMHLSAIVVMIIAVALPLWRLAVGIRPHEAYRVTSVAHTWTFALAIFYWPWIVNRGNQALARFLLVSAVLIFAGTALVVPTSGGAQWSPRFFIAVAPLLAIVAAAAARPAPAAPTIRWMARGILLASLVMQASGAFYVQRLKARHARLTHWLASGTAPGDVLISDVFWFPEVTATLAPSRRMLFSWDASDVPAMAAMAVRRGVQHFSVVTSAALTGYDAPPALDVPGAPCHFARVQRTSFDELGLLMSRYGCEDR